MKRIFGAVLTILGIAGLIYGAVLFVYSGGGSTDTKALSFLVLSAQYFSLPVLA